MAIKARAAYPPCTREALAGPSQVILAGAAQLASVFLFHIERPTSVATDAAMAIIATAAIGLTSAGGAGVEKQQYLLR